MRNLKTVSLALLTLLFSAIAITSCDWDNSPEPEHPLYVTYTISAGYVTFIGPDELLNDIQAWIKENQSVYDKPVNYTTGEASEFEKTDNEAIKKYEEFAPKFKAYLNEVVMKDLANGKYNDANNNTSPTVMSTFYITAARTQGKDGHLKYEEFKFSYP
jgi:hypothetical protein